MLNLEDDIAELSRVFELANNAELDRAKEFYGRYVPFGPPDQIGGHFPGGGPGIVSQKEEYGRYDRVVDFRIGEAASR